MIYFSRFTKIAFFLLICLLIAPTFGVFAATGRAPSINGKIAFASDRDGNYEIYVMNADGSGQTRLTNNNYKEGHPDWSPDGTKIVFTSNRDGNPEIYVMNANGSGQTRLTNNNYKDGEATWSPDGTKIVFQSDRDGNVEIYIMNANGSGQTRLTINSASDWDPNWSPDGTMIVFESDRNGNYEIYVMNANGSGQTRLTINSASDYEPFWQSLPRLNATMTLLSSTANTTVNATITLNATLSASISGQVTLYWALNGSEFDFSQTGNMTNGTYLRNFGVGYPGIWVFKVVWAGDDQYEGAESNNVTVNVSLPPPKQNATLTLQSSTTNTTVDTPFNLNATLSAPKSGTIKLFWSINGSGFNFQQTQNMTNGAYSQAFESNSLGIWDFKVVWAGDGEYNSAESNTVTVNISPPVAKQNATLTLQSTASNVVAGSTVTISGSLSPAQTGTVIISRSLNNGASVSIGTATLSNGAYSFQTLLNGTGTYKFNAEWGGNDNYNAVTSSTITVTATEAPLPATGIDPLWYAVIAVVVVAVIAGVIYFKRKK